MASPLGYFNGRLVPASDIALSLADAGFVSGATVVDNARTFAGRLFRWPDHLARFRRDCDYCRIPQAVSDAELTRMAEELVAHDRPADSDVHVVTVATPGPPGGPPTLAMTTNPIRVERYRPFFAEGVTLAVAGTQSAELSDLLPPGIKHRSRLHWHIADRRVPAGAVAVVMNHGAADTAIGSVAAVTADGTILLPPAGFVQESISLKVVGELAGELGIPVREGVADRPSELLLCGTGFGVAGVKTLTGFDRPRSFDWPGPVYRRLLAAWSNLVGVDIERQFLG